MDYAISFKETQPATSNYKKTESGTIISIVDDTRKDGDYEEIGIIGQNTKFY